MSSIRGAAVLKGNDEKLQLKRSATTGQKPTAMTEARAGTKAALAFLDKGAALGSIRARTPKKPREQRLFVDTNT